MYVCTTLTVQIALDIEVWRIIKWEYIASIKQFLQFLNKQACNNVHIVLFSMFHHTCRQQIAFTITVSLHFLNNVL